MMNARMRDNWNMAGTRYLGFDVDGPSAAALFRDRLNDYIGCDGARCGSHGRRVLVLLGLVEFGLGVWQGDGHGHKEGGVLRDCRNYY